MTGNYINLYDDELIGNIYLFEEKGGAAECEAIRAFHSNVNPEGLCQPGYFQPSDLPEVPHKDVATIFRECAGRRAAISVNTSAMGPKKMASYNFATSQAANTGFVDKTHGGPQSRSG